MFLLESPFFLKNIFQFSSVAQSCPTLCSPMNCSTPCLPVHHQVAKVSLGLKSLLLPHLASERLTEFWSIFCCSSGSVFPLMPLLLLRTLPSLDLSLVRRLFASVSERPFFLCILQYHDGLGSKQSSSIFSENSAPLHSTSSLCGEFRLDMRDCEVLLIFLYF